MRIVWNPALCYGCKTCQLICSFHHTGSFWPDRSSIKVTRNPQNGVIRWSIDSTCDRCSKNGPQCVKYCALHAINVMAQKMKTERDT